MTGWLGMAPLDDTVDVETPERIRFRHHVAGPFRRGLAYGIDLVLRAGLFFFISTLAVAGGASPSALAASQGAMLLALFLLEWAYFVVLEAALGGQTPGKRALGLRVVKENGQPAGFLDVALRNLLRAADFLPLGYLLGVAVMVGDRSFRRLGDRAAGTMVVHERRARASAPITLVPPPTPQELAALPGRVWLEPDELGALELYLRRPLLSAPRRAELAAMVAPVFAERLGVAPSALADPVRFLGLVYLRATGQTSRGPTT